MYHPTHALHNTPFMTYINSYMFRHLSKSLQQQCIANMPMCQFWSFRGDRIQWNFLGQTAEGRCEGFPTFRKLTPSPTYPTPRCVYTTQGRTASHQFWFYQTTSTPWRWGRSYFPKCREIHILTQLSARENLIECQYMFVSYIPRLL
jgi:hypothetical protein